MSYGNNELRPNTVTSSESHVIENANYVCGSSRTQYRVETHYVNGTNRYLKLTDRRGMNIVLPPVGITGDRFTGNLEARVFYNTKNNSSTGCRNEVDPDNIRGTDNTHRHQSSITMSAALRSTMDPHQPTKPKSNTESMNFVRTPEYVGDPSPFMGITYLLSMEDFDADSNGCGAVYIKELDMILSDHQSGRNVKYHHPGSLESNVLQSVVSDVDGLGFSIKIVDKKNVIGQRFMRLAGATVHIPISRDSSDNDGVYISQIKTGHDGRQDRVNSYYKLSDAKELPFLYRYEESATREPADAAELKHIREQQTHESNLSKQLVTELMDSLKHEREFSRHQRNERLEQIENRRKNFTEILKVAVAVLGAVKLVVDTVNLFTKKK